MVPTRFVIACTLGLAACIREEDVIAPPSSPPWAAVIESAPAVAATTTRGGAQRTYDTATEATLAGTVRSVEQASPGDAVHLRIAVDEETIAVHLGPRGYLDEIGLQPRVGDALTVVGARGPGFVIAREVDRGTQRWTLRDAAGTPIWGAQARRS